jgi:hypothetical protein
MPNQTRSEPGESATRTARRRSRRKRSHIELVLEQGEKLRAELAKLEEEVNIKRSQLEKFEQFKKSLEAS